MNQTHEHIHRVRTRAQLRANTHACTDAQTTTHFTQTKLHAHVHTHPLTHPHPHTTHTRTCTHAHTSPMKFAQHTLSPVALGCRRGFGVPSGPSGSASMSGLLSGSTAASWRIASCARMAAVRPDVNRVRVSKQTLYLSQHVRLHSPSAKAHRICCQRHQMGAPPQTQSQHPLHHVDRPSGGCDLFQSLLLPWCLWTRV